MKSLSTASTLINNLDKDFKAEVIAAEMVETGIPADRILILFLGAMTRSFRKDVDSVSEELSDYDHKEYFLVKSPRESIYDMLPQGLFHHPTAHKSAKTEKEIILTMKQRRKEEQKARRFFLPFEATINHLRMQMALYENRLDKRSHYDELVNIFSEAWEIFEYLDARQANIFLHLIPIIHDIRDDHPAVGAVLEMILMVPVEISLRSELPLHPAEPTISRLGENGLGVNLTTGNAVYEDGTDEILVSIGPVQNEALPAFMTGGKNQRILELLCDYLLPAHVEVRTEIKLEERDRTTRLADGVNDYNSSLGANTYL
jgi:type VI secretion system protein ImpH